MISILHDLDGVTQIVIPDHEAFADEKVLFEKGLPEQKKASGP